MTSEPRTPPPGACRALALALALAGCGGSEDPPPLLWVSRGGPRAPAILASNVFVVDATVNGAASAPIVVDTGAPIVLLPAGSFGGRIPAGLSDVSTLTLGGMTIVRVPVVGVPSDGALGSVGIAGFTAFGQFSMSFDYRSKKVGFGDAGIPSSVGAPESVRFSLEGGGIGRIENTVLGFPASRILVDVTVEGTRRPFVLDTGASEVAMRSSVFDELTTDGRARVSGDVTLVTGISTNGFTRTRSVIVGGAEVTGAVATAGAGSDALFESLAVEVGHAVDGLLGGSFLREFHVTIDYPSRALTLRRYATRDHIQDEFQRVGIELEQDPAGGYRVHQVYPRTDAEAQGIHAGTHVSAIDGHDLAQESGFTVDSLLLGPVGSTHTLDLDTGTFVVLVEELLPLP